MPAIQDIALEDVLADGRDLGLPPEEIAGAVKQWHNETLDWASKTHGDADPEHYFQGADELDKAAAAALGELRRDAVSQWADQSFDHPDTRAEFFDAYQAVDGKPESMPGFAEQAAQLNTLSTHEAFSLPKRPTGWLPVMASDGNELGRFTQRQRSDGSVEALLNYKSDDNSAATARLKVPSVADNDIAKARADAEAETKRWLESSREEQPKGWQASLQNSLDDGVANAGVTADWAERVKTAEQNAQKAALRAQMLADPAHGRALPMSERVAQAIKDHPELSKKVGKRDLAEDFVRGVQGFYVGSRVAWNDITRDDAERDQWRQHLSNLGQMFPGSTQRRNVGGASGFLADAAEGMGGMAPQIAMTLGSGGAALASAPARVALAAGGGLTTAASLGSMGLSTYGSGVNETLSRASELDSQAQSLDGVMPELAASMREQAQSLRDSHRVIATAKAANEVGSEFILPEETMLTKGLKGGSYVKRLGEGLGKSFLEGAAAEAGGQAINRAAFGDSYDLGDIARGGLLEAGAGGPLIALGALHSDGHGASEHDVPPLQGRSLDDPAGPAARAAGSSGAAPVSTPGASPQQAETPRPVAPPASRARVKMAEKVLTSQGVEPAVAAHFAGTIAGEVPEDVGPEALREQVLAKFAELGGVLPGSVPKTYVETPEAYQAMGYTPEESAAHAENSRLENAKAVDAAHQQNRTLLQEARQKAAEADPSHPMHLPSLGDENDPVMAKRVEEVIKASALPKPPLRKPTLKAAWDAFKGLIGRAVTTPIGLVVRIKDGHFAALTAGRGKHERKGFMAQFGDDEHSASRFRQAMDDGAVNEMPGFETDRAENLPLIPELLGDPDVILRPKDEPWKLVFVHGQKAGASDPRSVYTVYDTRTGELGLLSQHQKDLRKILPGHDVVYMRGHGLPAPGGNTGKSASPSKAPSASVSQSPSASVTTSLVSSVDKGGPGASSATEWGKSSFGKRLKADERLRASWRAAMSNRVYRKESEAEWQARANEFIATHGIEGAAAIYFDAESGLSESDRMALASQLSLAIDTEIRNAERAGDTARVAALDDLLHEITEAADSTATKLGQAIRVLGMWTRMSAEGVLRMFTKKVNTAREESLKTTLGKDGEEIAAEVTTVATEERADVAAEALGETTSDQLAELQRQVDALRQQLAQATQEAQAARQDATQATTPADTATATQKADLAEAKRKRAQRALKAAEDQQAKKAQQASKPRKQGEKKPKAINPQDLAEQLIGKLAESQSDTPASRQAAARRKNQVQQLAADYTAGRIDGPSLQAKLQELGIDAAQAATLRQLLDNETARGKAIDHARDQQRQREAPAKPINEWIDRLATSQSDTITARKQGKINALAQLIRDYLKEPDAAALPNFTERAVALGAPEAEAARLHQMLDKERSNMAAIARERAIARLVDQITPNKLVRAVDAAGKVVSGNDTRTQRLPRFLAKLFDAHELGAISRPEFLKAYAEAFELPVMDAAMQRKIRELIDAQRAAPEGFLKQEATTKLMAELALFKGVPLMEIGTAFWYANILSGLTTQGMNLWGNATSLLLRTLSIGATHNPVETWLFVRGLFEGAKRGAVEARAVLQTGHVPYKGDLKFTGGQTLELLHSDNPETWKGKLMNGVALGRFVFRALSAGDALFFHTLREGRAYLAAAQYARQQSKGNPAVPFATYLAEQLQSGGVTWQAVLDQARGEFKEARRRMKVGDLYRRAWEIIEEQRPPEITSEARRFGTWTTFNQEPEGTMGAIAGLVNEAHRRLSLPSPWGPIRILTPLIPFVNIVANVTSAALDFTPIGITRGMLGRHVRSALDRSANDFSSWEAKQRIASGVLGTLGSSLLFAWAYGMRDEDDDRVPFMIYGMGPGSKARRDQMPKGWKPYTIKVGDSYWSYAETPLSLILAIAGNTLDYLRYNPKGSQETAMGAAAYALATSPQALLKTGVLSSINDVFALLEGTRNVKQLAARTASGFIPGQALLRDISELFHGDKIDDTTMAAAMFKDVPVVRSFAGKPALNIFGEPVKLDVSQRLPIIKRIVTGKGNDPTSVWLAQHKLWIPGIDNKVAVTKYLTEADKFTLKGDDLGALAAKQARLAGDVLTEAERYRLVQESGLQIRVAVKQLQRDLADGWQPQPGQLQSRLSAKVVAARRAVMKQIAGLE